MSGVQEALQTLALKKNNEKSLTDKLLGRDDIEKIRLLMKKTELSREDLLDLLYSISSSESKLYNFDVRERYVMMKFFVWLRDFIMILEYMYEQEKVVANTTPLGKELFKKTKLMMEHNAKFLIDLYFNISRTTLSKDGTMFRQFLENKFEFSYDNRQSYTEERVKGPSLLGSIGSSNKEEKRR